MKTKMNDVVKKLLELNKLIKSLDPSIRQQSFDLLRPVFFGSQPVENASEPPKEQHDAHKKLPDTSSKESFFKSFDHKRASDNVFLIVAWLYSQHGVFSVSSEAIKTVADDTGLTVPGRPDMTLKQAGKKGKHLFTKQGSGYKPTVHGESFLKDKYRVKKGNIPFTKEAEN